ncbi:putative transcriptional regulator [Muricomes intestini]|uniref:Putative transcriptional regulator n=1 Tax=Muricomes intestini TaxID=1796634 RepID=A0A4R3K6D9_9FIRM|nr:helix-turn-helix transcriptional regulator [Muricomes intestini]TCS78350.1 putative transcriptional regulator [Muricomes intestini]
MKINNERLLLTMAKKNIYSFSQLSRESGVSKQTLSYIKNGKTCSIKTLNSISKALGVDVTEIIETD